ncbi:CaiB/BaiF CoA transferase family protein [Halalkalibacter oceani]|uniref:CaiB/BaiF CoA transferase family protein n=1 Tax=Halalkalibacter oceani TaxID=1653776 RepID=UPI0033911CF5
MLDKKRGPLENVRILDISTVFAAPFAASLLGDYGADVIKVEMPGRGDTLRGMQPTEQAESLPWVAVTRNKKAITLNLKKEKGQELFLRLVKHTDLLFENFRPGTLDKWGLPIERIREANPDLIIIHVSGYGHTGPARHKAGFGTSATAFSGYTYLCGYPDRPPLSPPVPLADYVTGIFAALGAMVALYHRDTRNGPGQDVDIALFESLFRILETVVIEHGYTGAIKERTGNEQTNAAPVGTFQAKDGEWLALTTSTNPTFYRLAEVLGRPEMKTDPDYSTNEARLLRKDELHQMIDKWFKQHTAEEIQQICDDNGIPICPVYDIASIFKDPQYKAREAIIEMDHPKLGKVSIPGVVPKFSKTPGTVQSVGPQLGEHNEEVYQQLGITQAELERYIEEGVI